MSKIREIVPVHRRQRLFLEYTKLRDELRGISPKLSSYITIQKRMNEITGILGKPPLTKKNKKVKKKKTEIY